MNTIANAIVAGKIVKAAPGDKPTRIIFKRCGKCGTKFQLPAKCPTCSAAAKKRTKKEPQKPAE